MVALQKLSIHPSIIHSFDPSDLKGKGIATQMDGEGRKAKKARNSGGMGVIQLTLPCVFLFLKEKTWN